eukprot:scaffold97652_cov66-Phaeocystis_antarctica.AAC.3
MFGSGSQSGTLRPRRRGLRGSSCIVCSFRVLRPLRAGLDVAGESTVPIHTQPSPGVLGLKN